MADLYNQALFYIEFLLCNGLRYATRFLTLWNVNGYQLAITSPRERATWHQRPTWDRQRQTALCRRLLLAI